jgi:hypothetical protein
VRRNGPVKVPQMFAEMFSVEKIIGSKPNILKVLWLFDPLFKENILHHHPDLA